MLDKRWRPADLIQILSHLKHGGRDLDASKTSPPGPSGTRRQVFHNLDNPNLNVLSQFLDYLQSFPPKSELLIIAHNAKSYDGVLVLQELVKRKLKPELTLQGAKIISMQIKTWKFIDSLMFLPMPLSAMP